MTIIFGSVAKLVVNEGGDPPVFDFAVLRDWLGRNGVDGSIRGPIDLSWTGTDHDDQARMNGPFEVQNQVAIDEGLDYLENIGGNIDFSTNLDVISIACLFHGEALINSSITSHNFNIVELRSATDRFLSINLSKSTGNWAIGARWGIVDVTSNAVSLNSGPNPLQSGWQWLVARFQRGGDVIIRTQPVGGSLVGATGAINSEISGSYETIMIGKKGFGASDDRFVRISTVLISRADLCDEVYGPFLMSLESQREIDDEISEKLVAEGLDHVHYYRCSEYDHGGDLGDRFIHDLSGFLHPANVEGGTLSRSIASSPFNPPFASENSYAFTDGAVATVLPVRAAIQHWGFSFFVWFRQFPSYDVGNDWFLSIETDQGEYVRLMRRDDGTVAPDFWRLRVEIRRVDGTITRLNIDNAEVLFDNNWRALVFTMGPLHSNWALTVNGAHKLPALASIPAQVGTVNAIRWGNIDTSFSYMGWKGAYDSGVFSAVNGFVDEQDIFDYVEANGYHGLYPHWDSEQGSD